MGIFSTLWLLLRSGKKPSRLHYPCQRLATANTLAFLAWLGSSISGHLLLRRLKKIFQRLTILSILVYLLLSVIKTYRIWQQRRLPTVVWSQDAPSRVVWIKDPASVRGWDNYDWEQKADQAVVNRMVAEAIKRLTAQTSVQAAWTWIFTHHNADHHDYRHGEKIAIKINFNNRHNYQENYNPTIQVIRAVLHTLIDEKGVSQEDIIVYDTSRPFVDYQIDGIHRFYPNVVLNPDHPGGPDRYGCTPSSQSVLGASLGKTLEEATYLINMPLLRTHSAAGITLSFKNHLGSTCQPDNFHGGFFATRPESNSLVRLNSHPYIRDKTILIVADALFGLKAGGPGGNPDGNTGIKPYPSSIFMATDPVAIDSVMTDYLESLGAKIWHGSDNPRTYLRVAAVAGLGNHSTSCSGDSCNFHYPNIDLVRCNQNCDQGSELTPTSETSFCSSCPSERPGKSEGNANCDSKIDLTDFVLWRQVYRKVLIQESLSEADLAQVDFNCQPGQDQHTVDLTDFSIWLNSYRQSLID